MIPPGDFIPLFEQNGLIGRVDLYVWEESARQLQKWREQFGTRFSITVSVNVSSMDIHMPGLEEKLNRLVDTYRIRPEELHLELTESAYMEDARLMQEVTDHLRSLGFRIEMDDFGAGYSSLNMLSTLPVDVLKMDMMFVRRLSREDSREYRFIEIVHDIARMLDIPMIAEGVEDAVQLELLKKIGCEYIQGYYFSPPVPAERFEEMMKGALR
jgi:EAL domain-containing protein (putative c-di-GMP-specific phosphodiesterase class I)